MRTYVNLENLGFLPTSSSAYLENDFVLCIFYSQSQQSVPGSTSGTPVPAHAPVSILVPVPAPVSSESNVYGQATSNLVAGGTLEATIQHILDMGGGSWD